VLFFVFEVVFLYHYCCELSSLDLHLLTLCFHRSHEVLEPVTGLQASYIFNNND